MDEKDIVAMLKRRRYQNNPEKYREKQNNYRKKIKENLPHCNECNCCVLVKKDKGEGERRLCIDKMQLIEQKVANCPHWCPKRTPREDYLKGRERMLKHKKEKYKANKERA